MIDFRPWLFSLSSYDLYWVAQSHKIDPDAFDEDEEIIEAIVKVLGE